MPMMGRTKHIAKQLRIMGVSEKSLNLSPVFGMSVPVAIMGVWLKFHFDQYNRGVQTDPKAHNVIYVGIDDWKLHAVNPDGTQKWTYMPVDWIVDSSPAIV